MYSNSNTFVHRPVTLLSVLVLQGEGGSIIANGIVGGGNCRNSGKGVGDFIFGKLTVIFKVYQNFLMGLLAA